jgi:hypothetical protein
MVIVFSTHSKEQNKIRKIPVSKIKQTLQKPDKIIESFRGRNLYQKSFGSKMLEVVIKTEDKKIIVITQYYLKK